MVIARSPQADHPPLSRPGGAWPRARQAGRWLPLAVTVVLHLLFVLLLWQQMRPPALPVRASAPDEVLHVRFIAAGRPSAPPEMALPPPPEAAARPSRPPSAVPEPAPKPEPPAPDAMSLQVPARPPALYDEDGRPRLPAAASSAPAPDYVQQLPQGDARIMRHDSPVEYRATRFDKDWGHGGSAVDEALSKVMDKVTVKKTLRLPGGIRLHCAISPLGGGCGGDPPAPPSAKDGDARLSMAPAKPLDGEAYAPEKPSVEACIAMYRAGKPLVWGCPSDTPLRAVDAETRERAEAEARGNARSTP